MLMLLLYLGLFSSEVLVLKNGKKVACDQYQVEAGRIKITRKQQTFTLPESAVDWDKTNAFKKVIAARREAKVKAREEAKRAAREGPKTRIRIDVPFQVSGDAGVAEVAGAPQGKMVNGSFEVPFVKYQNHIIVKVFLNGTRQYKILFDTGASTTVISPKVAKRLGIKKGRPVIVAGVGGEELAHEGVLGSMALGGARVGDLRVVIHELPMLNNADIIGLLGQDFLNHFQFSLDPKKKVIGLKPLK